MTDASDPESRLLDAGPLVLRAGDLQYKWGFEDGDLVWYWASEAIGEEGAEKTLGALSLDYQDALCLLVWAFLIPQIEEELEPFEIAGVHNPMRTRTVAGELTDQFEEEALPSTPALVEVPAAAVLEVSDLEKGDIAGALLVAARHGAFGEEELVRALQSTSDRLREAAMRASAEFDLEADRPRGGGRRQGR